MEQNQTIGNKHTGETLTLLVDEKSNDGASNSYEVYLPSLLPGPPLHCHIDFIEIFAVKKVRLDFYLDIEERNVSITAGQCLTVGIRQLHRFSNNDDEPVICTVESRPAGGPVRAFQLAYGVANDGGAGLDGLPSNILVKQYFIKLSRGYLANIHLFFQKPLVSIATFILIITARKRKLDEYFSGC
jgi:mannose-6-phosphate isomerase-like protein (cupin superfamily)